jgi:hypothetical protein
VTVVVTKGDSARSGKSRRRTALILLLVLGLVVALILVLDSRSPTTRRNLPISYRHPTTTLDWEGFKIHATSCSVVAETSGLTEATVHGTAIVPARVRAPGIDVVGQIEAWIFDSAHHVMSKGKPWPLPGVPGTYHWVVGGFAKSAGQPASCVIQGIDVSDPYQIPQAQP